LLHAVELLVHKSPATTLNRVPHIIKALFDLDICEDSAILEWAEKPSSRYVPEDFVATIIAKAKDVIEWLKECGNLS
jgi:hypothetical protein